MAVSRDQSMTIWKHVFTYIRDTYTRVCIREMTCANLVNRAEFKRGNRGASTNFPKFVFCFFLFMYIDEQAAEESLYTILIRIYVGTIYSLSDHDFSGTLKNARHISHCSVLWVSRRYILKFFIAPGSSQPLVSPIHELFALWIVCAWRWVTHTSHEHKGLN